MKCSSPRPPATLARSEGAGAWRQLAWTSRQASRVQRVFASVLVFLPLVGVALCAAAFWNHGISWLDLILAVSMYAVTGFGVTVGFHRMLAHTSFRPNRPLKVALAVAGSMAIEGSALIWVAHHRKHHVYADREADPHSPWAYGSGFAAQLKGLAHAHVGWLFLSNPPEPERWAADLQSDADIRIVSRTDAVWFALSLAIPFAIGYVVTGSFYGGWAAFLWAGVVRVVVLHHVTWGVNSIGHMFGSRPFRTRDRSTNVALPISAQPRRLLAQRPSRVPDAGPPRCGQGTNRRLGSSYPSFREDRVGHRRSLAHARAPGSAAPLSRSGIGFSPLGGRPSNQRVM